MSLDRILDHVVHAAAWRAMHGVSPLTAGLIVIVAALWVLAARRRP